MALHSEGDATGGLGLALEEVEAAAVGLKLGLVAVYGMDVVWRYISLILEVEAARFAHVVHASWRIAGWHPNDIRWLLYLLTILIHSLTSYIASDIILPLMHRVVVVGEVIVLHHRRRHHHHIRCSIL